MSDHTEPPWEKSVWLRVLKIFAYGSLIAFCVGFWAVVYLNNWERFFQ